MILWLNLLLVLSVALGQLLRQMQVIYSTKILIYVYLFLIGMTLSELK